MSLRDGAPRPASLAEKRCADELRAALADSIIFDAAWYASRYAAVLHADEEPLAHFVRHGAAAGLRPCSLFDTSWYLRAHPQAVRSGLNPLLHFLRNGRAERLKPHRLFDTGWYLATYRSAAASALDPLSHYLLEGSPACRPNVLFDPSFYVAGLSSGGNSGQNPLAHFLERGAAEGASPNPFFDTRWYLAQYVDARVSHLDPLSHFLEVGAARDYRPNPLFDTAWYRATYLAGAAPGTNPLCHFIELGATHETRPNPLFDFSLYAATIDREMESRAALHRGYLADDSNICLPAHMARQASSAPLGGLRLLFLDAAYPRPEVDSGSLDTVNHLKILVGLGLKVTFVATAEFFATGAARIAVCDLGVDCVDTQKFSSVEGFLERCGGRFDVVVLSRVYAGGHFFELARSIVPRATLVFNPIDLHHVRELREAAVEARSPHVASGWTRAREFYLARRCDTTIVVSTAEAALLHTETPNARVALVPLLREIPGRTEGFHRRRDLGFVGGFGHRPNVDAVEHFLDATWPLLLELVPDLRFEVVGAGVPERLRRRTDRNVAFLGQVDALPSVLARWRLTVAPLRFGAGAKGKIVSSLAHGVPCIATPVAAEGMEFRDGEIKLAADPRAFATAVRDLYFDETAWYAASDAGVRAVTDRNDIRRGAKLWTDLLVAAGTVGVQAPQSAGTTP